MKNNKLNSGSGCCHSAQNTLFGVLFLENVRLYVCKCDNLLHFLDGEVGVRVESRSVMLNVAHN
jgi:hypothetical protein